MRFWRSIKNRVGTAKPSSVTMQQKVKEHNRWREQYNPLRGLTIARAVALLEAGQRGEFADLQWTYHFIEMTDATLFALLDRCNSALLQMDWNIKVVDSDLAEKYPDDAKKQVEYLRSAYDRIDNLYELIEHLSMARFRAFSIAQPRENDEGLIDHIECLDQWNFLRDGMYGDWWWNPESKSTSFRSLPEEHKLYRDDLIIRECRRHIDRVALIKFIRKNLGEKDWTSFIEIYGVPGAYVIGPPNVPEGREADYEAAGLAAAQGGSGYLPNGADVKTVDGPRGVNPFRDFLRWCDEQMVIAGTGGMLTMLAESGSGTLAGNAHQETFDTIARGEARKISEIMQEQFDKRLLASKFPDQPILAYFELAANEEQDVGEIFDHAVKAFNSGNRINVAQLSEKTGYTLEPTPGPQPGSPPIIPISNRALSASAPVPNRDAGEDLVAVARLQLAESQHAALKIIADPLIDLVARLKSGSITAADAQAEASALRSTLPDKLIEMNIAPETITVLEDTMSAALANGIAEAAEGTGVAG